MAPSVRTGSVRLLLTCAPPMSECATSEQPVKCHWGWEGAEGYVPAALRREERRRGARLGQRRGHHVRGLPGRRQRLDHLGHGVVGVHAGLVTELPVLVLYDEEPGQLLAQLRQRVADQLKAADDVP